MTDGAGLVPVLDRRALPPEQEADPGALPATAVDADAVERWARRAVAPLFAPGIERPARVGVEIEWIPVDARTRLAVPIGTGDEEDGDRAGSLALLRAAAREAGWGERPSASGAPHFSTAGGGTITYEPGGQIEFSAPAGSVADSISVVTAVHTVLDAAARAHGVVLLSCGLDPVTPLDAVPLQLTGERYRRMDRYLGAIGSAGLRMMRQTASLQVNIDPSGDPEATWRMLNAAAPVLTALFANSPLYGGADTGHRSYRAQSWRTLDAARTGLFAGDDPAGEYARFALDAPYMLTGEDVQPRAMRAHLTTGAAGLAEWTAHLTTLFPEIRPRGWFEVRSIDAQPVADLAAPLVLLAGLTGDLASLRAASELLGRPDPALLVQAGVAGLRHPTLLRQARELTAIAGDGFARMIAAGSPLAAPSEPAAAVLESASRILRRLVG